MNTATLLITYHDAPGTLLRIISQVERCGGAVLHITGMARAIGDISTLVLKVEALALERTVRRLERLVDVIAVRADCRAAPSTLVMMIELRDAAQPMDIRTLIAGYGARELVTVDEQHIIVEYSADPALVASLRAALPSDAVLTLLEMTAPQPECADAPAFSENPVPHRHRAPGARMSIA